MTENRFLQKHSNFFSQSNWVGLGSYNSKYNGGEHDKC